MTTNELRAMIAELRTLATETADPSTLEKHIAARLSIEALEQLLATYPVEDEFIVEFGPACHATMNERLGMGWFKSGTDRRDFGSWKLTAYRLTDGRVARVADNKTSHYSVKVFPNYAAWEAELRAHDGMTPDPETGRRPDLYK